MTLRVLRPGILMTVQDAGRHGYQHLGLCPGGAMDPVALALANALVGNETDDAALEITVLGPDLEFAQDTLVALCGALAAGPGLLKKGMADLRLAMPVALIASTSSIFGAMMGLALPAKVVQVALGATILGIVAIRRRDFVGHGGWMMRGYAIGLGAGTQVLTLMVGELIAGPPSEFSRALLMGAAWGINLAVAEWIIRKPPARPARPASAVVSPLR